MVMRQRTGPQCLPDLNDPSLDTPVSGTSFPPTYYVMQFNPTVKTETVRWIVSKLCASRREHGAELLVRKQDNGEDSEQGLTLHMSSQPRRLLEAAEDMELRVKPNRTSCLRRFTIKELEAFVPDSGGIDDFLTSTEKQSIVKFVLDNLRAVTDDQHVPGYPQLILYEGQSLVEALINWKLIRQMFPLHDEDYLKALGHSWYKSLSKDQPFEDIHAYFGESIALYFHFLNFYSYSLVVPMILGFYQLLVSNEMLAFFCVFQVLWATGFLVMWNRKCSELAFQWGTINMTSLNDNPRPTFHGKMGEDPVTGKMQPQYPSWKTYTKMYCVSFPLVVGCMLGSFLIMLASFWLDRYIRSQPYSNTAGYIVYVPSILYAALVYIMNMYYRELANYLTEWENHRTQSQFDRYRITKLVLFEFVNNFMSLFYVAFYIQDLDMLRTQLAVLLTIYQLINNLQESILPLILQYTHNKVTLSSITKRISSDKIPLLKNIQGEELRQRRREREETKTEREVEIPLLDSEDSRIVQTKRESQLDPYEGTYDDYLELFIQFGYVYLFSAVFPMAAFWALINNMLEVRSDAFKLCCLYQRPIARQVKNIGAWQRAFECLCAISVMTNCALLFMIPELRSLVSHWSNSEVLFMFVVFEHILLLLRYVLVYCISDKPQWVRVALAKQNYQSRQAMKT
uniref:Anoctamin n=1 Tax=Cacopsylla melanoneura TaxID=428564 RepID=A0A8D8RF30_9HEMI